MTPWTVDSAATALLGAEDDRADREPLTDDWPGLDLATGYAVQDETLRRRLARGERLAGLKLGLTSVAKQQRMGISTPLTAWLTDAMVLPAGAAVPRDQLIHPRAEPEIVFVMRDRLAGPGVTAATALAAAEEVVRPFIPRLPWMDRASVVQGYAGVYSSFLLHAQRAAERYGVPAHVLLQRAGEAGYVGGQEDMIIDIALQVQRERETAGAAG